MAEAYDDRSVIKKLSDLKQRVEKLEDDSGGASKLEPRVASLETSMSAAQSKITKNSSDITVNRESIAVNTGDITALKKSVSEKTAKIEENSMNIIENTAKIEENTVAIQDNSREIAARQKSNLIYPLGTVVWTADTTYDAQGYKYKWTIQTPNLRAKDFALVMFDFVSAASGSLSPSALTGDGTVTVWSKVDSIRPTGCIVGIVAD